MLCYEVCATFYHSHFSFRWMGVIFIANPTQYARGTIRQPQCFGDIDLLKRDHGNSKIDRCLCTDLIEIQSFTHPLTLTQSAMILKVLNNDGISYWFISSFKDFRFNANAYIEGLEWVAKPLVERSKLSGHTGFYILSDSPSDPGVLGLEFLRSRYL